MPTLATTHTLEQAAALLGKKTDTLKKWFGQGCPHEKNARGYRVNVAEVFDWRIEREKAAAQGEGGEALVLETERAKLAREQRIGQEMANAQKRGQLVEVESVKRSWIGMIAACRAKLLALPEKIAARLGVPNPRKVAAAIREEIVLALKELADGS